MYEVTERRRKLDDGTEITTYTRDVVSCNILQVEAGTTGYKGGDTGHGGRTYFRIQDAASTDMEIKPPAPAARWNPSAGRCALRAAQCAWADWSYPAGW